MRKEVFIVVVALTYSTSGWSQGILNSGFEDYDRQSGFLAGWHVTQGMNDYGTVQNGVEGSRVGYQLTLAGELGVSIYGKGGAAVGLPSGEYYFFARALPGFDAIARQTVRVPENARTIQYRALQGFFRNVAIRLDDVFPRSQVKEIVMPGGDEGLVADWWADISSYQGKEVNLAIYLTDVGVGIDDLRFSTEPIPEPQAAAVFFAGLGTWWCLRRRKRHWR